MSCGGAGPDGCARTCTCPCRRGRTANCAVWRGAVCIQKLSAFVGEEEFVLAPGTRFKVRSAEVGKDRLCTVVLDELDAPRMVA